MHEPLLGSIEAPIQIVMKKEWWKIMNDAIMC